MGISRVIRLALGIRVHAHFHNEAGYTQSPELWQPGERYGLALEVDTRLAKNMGDCTVDTIIITDSPWQWVGDTLALDSSAQPSNPYPDTRLPDEPTPPCIGVRVSFNNVLSTSFLPLDLPPVVLPATRASLFPERVLINTTLQHQSVQISIKQSEPQTAKAELLIPNGWQVSQLEQGLQLTPPSSLADGLYELPLTLDAQAAMQVKTMRYPHVSTRALSQPACVRVRATHMQLSNVRIGYAGGGNDDVEHWLRAMGVPVSTISDSDLDAASSLEQWLSGIDTLLIGVFAYRTRAQLSALSKTINDWVRAGGHLLTLYHRPSDNWNPLSTPPLRLEIGQPSLRYRVCDENAEVSYLVPEHPLLNTPNEIGPADWANWHKERGLHFAKSWDEAYTPLISMSDPGEAAHNGSLLCADIGQGRHIHTSLILHHQMNQLVPGSFRLMANLVS